MDKSKPVSTHIESGLKLTRAGSGRKLTVITIDRLLAV